MSVLLNSCSVWRAPFMSGREGIWSPAVSGTKWLQRWDCTADGDHREIDQSASGRQENVLWNWEWWVLICVYYFFVEIIYKKCIISSCVFYPTLLNIQNKSEIIHCCILFLREILNLTISSIFLNHYHDHVEFPSSCLYYWISFTSFLAFIFLLFS